jgi:cation:H+ antiporter
MKLNRDLASIFIAILVTIPGIYLRIAGIHLSPLPMASFAGLAILGASFLVLWACDVCQEDVSQTLALALVALIAVLPEYAVDMYFTWMAGRFPEQDYAHYAIANMTGANRLLIGIGWPVMVFIAWVKSKKGAILEKERATELLFLLIATLYAFVIVIKGALAWFDGIVFIAIFITYIVIASRRPCVGCELVGPAMLIGSLPVIWRRITTIALFVFAAGSIVANAEPFSEGLVNTGKMFGINEFLLVQWLAPIASEAPEFAVAIMFASRGQAGLGLGALLSSKLNQWTLLVGMIPGVYGASSGQLHHPIPMSTLQMHEILLTAAQSLLGVVLLVGFRLTMREAVVLLTLFLGQFILSPVADTLVARGVLDISGDTVHQVFSTIYITVAVVLIVIKPSRFKDLLQGYKLKPEICLVSDTDKEN